MSSVGLSPTAAVAVDSPGAIPGELLYEYAPQVTITEVVEYGAGADAVLSGQVAPPAEGARFDFVLEGHIDGPNLEGRLQGVDYLYVHADGRIELHIRTGNYVRERNAGLTGSQWYRSTPGIVARLPTSRERHLDQQSPGALLGESAADLGLREGGCVDRAGVDDGLQSLSAPRLPNLLPDLTTRVIPRRDRASRGARMHAWLLVHG